MSFKPKNLTQGGQITAYRLRMFGQVNSWIFSWVLVLFVLCAGVAFWAITPEDTLRNGTWYWFGWMFSGLVPLMPPRSPATWEVHWHCVPDRLCTTKMTLTQMLADPWMQQRAADMLQNLRLCLSAFGVVAVVLLCLIIWYVGRIGRKESEDEFISGMTLTEDLKLVNRQLKKAGEKSDLQVGGLHMVRNAEIMNYLIHGTVNVGKSTIIRWLLDYIRKRGDRAIIYDSGGTFVETHYDERRDKILNTHDRRCENWVLWREGREVVDYENMTAALMPVEGDSDPFWVSSSRTIFSDTAMQFASDPQRNIEKFLKTLLSIDLKSLREFLKNTPSANLVEEKIEKTAISIRSVLTNYAKSLRYLQGLDKEGKPEFSIREWMTEKQYDSSWLFISTTARHRKSVRPLITMWLSLATIFLQSMGEDSRRRVWIIGDEILNLQKLPDLGEHMAEGRKFGACFVLGIQNMPQLINVYGREMARAIFDLLNTRFYGRSPSAEVAKMVEEDLGNQRRREAREQNSFGLAQERDGISISKDKVREPVVDYDQIMKLPNLRFYVRLPGEYPVVKLSLKYREQKKYHPALIERDFRDNLSPELENIIRRNEREAAGLGLRFPAVDETAENVPGRPAVPEPVSAEPVTTPAAVQPGPVSSATATPQTVVPAPHLPPAQAPSGPVLNGSSASDAEDRTPTPAPASNVTPMLRRQAAPVLRAVATPEGPGDVNPLNRLRRVQNQEGEENSGDEAAPAAGDAPDLRLQTEKDDAGRLTLHTAGHAKADPDSRAEAYAAQYRQANYRMADDEKNILRHRDDYETWQEMGEHHDHGDYER